MYIEQVTVVEQKQCTKCKQLLNVSSFYWDKANNAYISNYIVCRREYNNNYDRKVRNGTLNRWVQKALVDSKKRAIAKGLEHNLTKEWILANLPTVCPVLGIKLSFTGDRNTTPSLDRFDNTKGYTTDNVRIISFRANVLKSNASVEELEAIVRYMKK